MLIVRLYLVSLCCVGKRLARKLVKSETRESFLGAAIKLMTAIVLCTCDESYQGEGEGGTLLTQNTFVECERKIYF